MKRAVFADKVHGEGLSEQIAEELAGGGEGDTAAASVRDDNQANR